MARLHALELVPDEAGREVVRQAWQALRDAGLPSQLDHRGSTNAPHVTVVAAPELGQDALDLARVRLGALLPIRARVAGLLLLGERRVSLAWAVEVDDDVVRRALAMRVHVPGRQHAGWVPHVTLARRVDRADLPRALEALSGLGDGEELSLTELRWWDPDLGRVQVIAQSWQDPTCEKL